MAKKEKISKKNLEQVTNELLSVLSEQNRYGTFSYTPIYIGVEENQTSDKGSGYNHIFTVKLSITYLKNKRIKYIERISAHTDEQELMAETYIDYIKLEIDKKYNGTITDEKHFFIKKHITGGYQIEIIKKDGS